MYRFKVTNNIDEFNDFVLHNNGSFFQTSMGANMKKNWGHTYFIATDKNNQLVLSALLLTRPLFKVIKMGYIHSGFVCDYKNDTLLKEAIKYFNKYFKDNNIAFVFFDPEVKYKIDGSIEEDGKELIKKLEDWKLKKSASKEPFVQPSFAYIINLMDKNNKSKKIDDVISSFEKGVRYSVRTASKKGLRYECYTFDDITKNTYLFDEFINIMSDTMSRLETTIRSKEYYYNVLKSFNKYAVLDLVYYDYHEDTVNNIENLRQLELLIKENKDIKMITSLTNEIDSYNKRIEDLKKNKIDIHNLDKLYLAGGITIFYGDTTTCLYGGTRDVLRNLTRSSHFLNYKRIENSIKRKMKYHDFLRAHVYYRDGRDKNYGLSIFKKSFGALETEYIGEFIFVNNKLFYYLFKAFYKRFLKLILYFKKYKK